jgi:putative addiction module component (TIGR02574 family)
MTELLHRAFDEAAKLPPAEQDLLGQRLLAELTETDAPLTEAQAQELNRRLAAYRAEPDKVFSFEQVEREALARMQP